MAFPQGPRGAGRHNTVRPVNLSPHRSEFLHTPDRRRRPQTRTHTLNRLQRSYLRIRCGQAENTCTPPTNLSDPAWIYCTTLHLSDDSGFRVSCRFDYGFKFDGKNILGTVLELPHFWCKLLKTCLVENWQHLGRGLTSLV